MILVNPRMSVQLCNQKKQVQGLMPDLFITTQPGLTWAASSIGCNISIRHRAVAGDGKIGLDGKMTDPRHLSSLMSDVRLPVARRQKRSYATLPHPSKLPPLALSTFSTPNQFESLTLVTLVFLLTDSVAVECLAMVSVEQPVAQVKVITSYARSSQLAALNGTSQWDQMRSNIWKTMFKSVQICPNHVQMCSLGLACPLAGEMVPVVVRDSLKSWNGSKCQSGLLNL